MNILLAVAVMVVAVASWFISASLRSQIRQNAAELEQARKQIAAQCAEQVEQAEERLKARDHDQAGPPGGYEVIQQQISEAQAHLARHDDEMRHDQVRAGEQETATTQLGAALRQEARQREKDIARLEQAFHGKLATQLSAGLDQEARQRRQEIQQLQRALRDPGPEPGQGGAAVTRAPVPGEDLAGAPDGLRPQAERQLAGVLSGVDQQLSAIRRYVRAQLDREVAMTRGNKGQRVLVGGICAQRPAAAGTLPLLYESFLSELPAEMLFRDSAHASSDRFYLLWSSRNGQSLEGRLEMLLRGCPRDGGTPAPGLDELRGLLLALHRAGPGTVQVGPLVVVRTDRDLVGTVLAATDASLLDGRTTLPAPEECRVLLGKVGGNRLADLGPWADSHS